MALLLCLGLTAALARGCLHCHGNFSDKFSFYRHHVNLKSWWVGDIPVSGSLLSDWSQDTMKELHLAIPAEITREKLNQVANAVYQRMDQLYQGKMYFPGYFPSELRAIFREQVHLIQNAIIESWGRGLPGGSVVKNLPASAGDTGLIPGSGRTPWRRKWQPTPVFLLGEALEPGMLQSTGSQRIGHDFVTEQQQTMGLPWWSSD
ncbi:izumo sperm-egg fusion protein 4 isoform X2 [Ovis canadensis]|uniref:izumo sperm-egg fusion protein 4 isoform X2 n=1 Tax=Ovis canadensis TaxID=37174 RepID=UPI00375385FF